MRVYLAMTQTYGMPDSAFKNADILASYIYLRNNPNLISIIPHTRSFLCDSGLFTFLNSGKKVEMEKYADEYADFVRENNIRDYIELDVDQLRGVEYTRRLRDRIEARVGWQSIPVWHTIRGKEAFIQDCKDYPRVAVGFLLAEGLPQKLSEKYVPWFIDTAHEHGARIHGLGFTKTEKLPLLHFDSVDSSSFTAGGRFGVYQYFDTATKTMKQVQRKAGTRMPSANALNIHNYHEWRRYQDWAYSNIPIIW